MLSVDKMGLEKYLEAGRASSIATLEPVVAAIAAYIFMGEYFTPLGYFGAALIIAAVITTVYSDEKNAKALTANDTPSD